MNSSRVLNIPMRKLAIVTLILFAVGGFAILITAAWSLIQFPSNHGLRQTDAWQIVNDFHVAINTNNVDDALALFTDSATITDNRSLINDKSQIRDWVLYSKRMAGLHLKMVHSETNGEKVIWLDTAHNEEDGQSRYYILRWEAVIVKGKIQSLVVMPRYMPDLK